LVRAPDQCGDAAGFPFLEAQLRWSMRNEAVMHLADFYFRRVPLFLARADHGEPWIDGLAAAWAEERGFPASAAAGEARDEAARLREEIARRMEPLKL
jgi:glycerol-3-phosphate dehydrogenase